MIAHRFGMFDFNTVDPAMLSGKLVVRGLEDKVCLPEIGKAYMWIRGGE